MEPLTPDRSAVTNPEVNPGFPSPPVAPVPAPTTPEAMAPAVATQPTSPVQPVPAAPVYQQQYPQQYAQAPSPGQPVGIVPGAPWPGAFETIGMAFKQVRKNPQPAIILLSVYVVLGILDVVVGGGNHVMHTASSINSHDSSSYSILGLIILLASPIYTLALADRKIITVREFFKVDVRAYLSIPLAYILLALMLGISSIAIFIPWIWLVPWFVFIAYAIIEGAGPVKAFTVSKELGQHHKGKVWGLIGASILMSIGALILAFIPVIGALISSVASGFISILVYGGMATLYRWIQQNQQAQPAPVYGVPVVPLPPLAVPVPPGPTMPAPPAQPIAPAPLTSPEPSTNPQFPPPPPPTPTPPTTPTYPV